MQTKKTGPGESTDLQNLLVINAGSSSIKFAFFNYSGNDLTKTDSGQISGIAQSGSTFQHGNSDKEVLNDVKNFPEAISFLLKWFDKSAAANNLSAFGHRIVHGMSHCEPALITQKLIEELKEIVPYDPDHLPQEIGLIETIQKHYPHVDQYACFDTAFHQHMPKPAKMLAIPRHFVKKGIRRYGFHGLSYQYLINRMKKTGVKSAYKGRVILAHLGSGASLAAVHNGLSVETTMGFTPASGIPMSSRSGDLDPGAAWFMLQLEKLSPKEFNHLVNHESGLTGISETTGDMSQLLRQESTDVRSADAVNFFCYQVKKAIGALSAVLGGLDTLVFSGGIGENAPAIRARICTGMEYLGISLNEKMNAENQYRISAKESLPVLVIKTDEEQMIAEIVHDITLKRHQTTKSKPLWKQPS